MASSGTHPFQWATLVDFIERHPEMVTHKFVGMHGGENFHKLWEELSAELNCMGFGMRESKKWQEIFGKWKSKVEIKAQDIICNAQKTGAGATEDSPLKQLSPVEERLVALIGWKISTGDKNKEMVMENVFDENPEDTNAGDAAERGAPSTARLSLVPLELLKNSRTLNSPLPGTSKTCILPLPKLSGTTMDVPPPIPFKKRSVQISSLKNEDEEVAEKVRSPEIITKNRKLAPRKNLTGKAKLLLDMHEENVNVLKEINANLARLADSKEAQTKIVSEFLDILKTKF